MAHRAAASGKVWLGAVVGLVCFITQLATPEVGVFGIVTAISVLLLSRLPGSAIVALSAFAIPYSVSDQARAGDHIWWISDVTKFRSHYPDWEYAYDIERILCELTLSLKERSRSA